MGLGVWGLGLRYRVQRTTAQFRTFRSIYLSGGGVGFAASALPVPTEIAECVDPSPPPSLPRRIRCAECALISDPHSPPPPLLFPPFPPRPPPTTAAGDGASGWTYLQLTPNLQCGTFQQLRPDNLRPPVASDAPLARKMQGARNKAEAGAVVICGARAGTASPPSMRVAVRRFTAAPFADCDLAHWRGWRWAERRGRSLLQTPSSQHLPDVERIARWRR